MGEPCLEGTGQVKVTVNIGQTKIKEQEETSTWGWGETMIDRRVVSPEGVRRLGLGESV